MFDCRRLVQVWLLLLAITLGYALLADGADPSAALVLLICGGVALKGQLVIDRLMGLAGSARPVRWSMLSYFYLLPPLIALAWLFPGLVRQLTSL